MKILTGAEIVVESLYCEKVEYIFGYPGGAILDIYDKLSNSDIEYIMPHHEQGGIHAADGYARSTGKVGVCITTSGPGATNLVTGLATAYMDSIPVVAFTGQVPVSMLGTDSFQEADITGITSPITKHNYLVLNVDNLAQTIKEAFHIARTGRPGPVLIDLPKDVLKAKTEFDYPKQVNLPGYKPNYKGHNLQIKTAAETINKAKKPVIYAGGGVIISDASDELRKLSKKSDIPVTTTLMGIGSFDENEKLSLGMLGLHGSVKANRAISSSDLLIAIGARFDNRVTGKIEKFAPEAKIIHIDIDPAEIGKRKEIDIPIVGDVKNVLKDLNKIIKENQHKKWVSQIQKWEYLDGDDKKEASIKEAKSNDKLTPRQIIEELDNLTSENTLIITEVGQHQMWAAHFYKYSKPRSFISSGGLGTMGYGFPASIGAQLGNIDKTVVVLAGDGSFQMNMQELATVAKNKLPVNIIIFNNQQLGMIRQLQEVYYDKRYFSTCLRKRKDCPSDCSISGKECPELIPDFVKLAEVFGIKGQRVVNSEEIKPKLKKAINSSEPYLLDFIIEEEENVFPMVLSGDSLDNMILREDLNI